MSDATSTVGWVERSDSHRPGIDGYRRRLNPSYKSTSVVRAANGHQPRFVQRPDSWWTRLRRCPPYALFAGYL